ncbi:MAG: hypothetical protein IT355_13810 [Gemmatimonadaceae bacterium]|nr:hypothetical protein [Gemmatimonadaceae bacterium]
MHQSRLSWMRAAGVGAGAFAVLALAFLFVPHWILTGLTAPARGVRVWMATAWIALVFGASCVAGWRATARPGNTA